MVEPVSYFRTPTYITDDKSLQQLYERPYNTFGVVPNSGKDVGGTPVLSRP